MAKIISFINQKGGVGKTTTTFNFGYELSKVGKKVLLVDFDPQANLTVWLGNRSPESIDNSIYKILLSEMREEEYNVRDYIYTDKNGIDYLPSSIELSSIELELMTQMSREYILKSVLSSVKDDYDYILIDCMPSLGLLIINALTASDSVIITATTQYLSVKGLALLLETVNRVKKRINRKLIIDGILITMYQNHIKGNKEIFKLISEEFGDYIRIFETKIPKSVITDKSSYEAKAIAEVDKNNQVAVAYKDFAQEYLRG